MEATSLYIGLLTMIVIFILRRASIRIILFLTYLKIIVFFFQFLIRFIKENKEIVFYTVNPKKKI